MSANASERGSRGLILILAATAVAGASGYAIQLLAPALLDGAESYLTFSAFWSVLFLLGSAVGGLQQEVARASSSADWGHESRSIRRFTLCCAAAVAIVTVAFGLVIGPTAFGEGSGPILGALVIGLLGYVLTSIITGLFYGLGTLGFVAALIAVDAGLRGVAVVVGFVVGASIDVIAYLVALPFGLAVTIVWQFARSRVVGRYRMDVGDLRLARNALSTVVSAAAIGMMVTGMPLLFRVTLTDASPVVLASLTLVVTLTRAPFIIPLMALQSYLVVGFRDAPDKAPARVRTYLLTAGGVGIVAAWAATVIGPWAVDVVSGSHYGTDAISSAVVVVSATMVGCMCITGPALLAVSRHGANVAGWIVAALTTAACLVLVPADPTGRALIALVAAPFAGLVVHGLSLARPARRDLV